MNTVLKSIFLFTFVIAFQFNAVAQLGEVTGNVSSQGAAVEYATVIIEGTSLGAHTNQKGNFKIDKISEGQYTIIASYVGFKPIRIPFSITATNPKINLDFVLAEKNMDLDAIVVTGTKTFKRKTNSPVIVNITSSKTLETVQACNLSEGLKFQPGLRVETDCQTCNYTQLRMNGLAGGYSQILINGRPIFSPLTGLYGLEQLPVNMIERIEVIKGGGSSLYGSSAIGGTVNVITKIPRKNSYELNYNYQNINGQTNDNQILGNTTFIGKKKNAGVSLFVNHRNRDFYDHNNDNYSEIPLIENTSVGANMFYLPKENQKLELNISNLNEYRFGGEMISGAAHTAKQAEERNHKVWMANLDYQINFNNNNSSFISYLAWQKTKRNHYTGIIPDSSNELQNHLLNPPYGTSDVNTKNVGVQLNHRLTHFLNGTNTLTIGLDYIFDDVMDEIEAYQYLVDQKTTDLGLFLQSDWEINSRLTLLTGIRLDQHNLLDYLKFSPRSSLLFKYNQYTQFRIGYGQGFRAPQAFDTDLHIAFAAGGVSRVFLSPYLKPETSESFNASINFDKPNDHFIYGFTLDGFVTKLNDAFYLNPVGEDSFGELFEKQNGQGATVQGITLELRANYDRKLQVESGFTIQSSQFEKEVTYISEVDGIKDFVRTPNNYGFVYLSLSPKKQINLGVNYIYTDKMLVPHFAGAINQATNEIITSKPFHELSSRLSYTLINKRFKSKIEIYTGVKNIFNSYQSTFDIGKNRDSNFIFGPSQPRTLYIGLKIKS